MSKSMRKSATDPGNAAASSKADAALGSPFRFSTGLMIGGLSLGALAAALAAADKYFRRDIVTDIKVRKGKKNLESDEYIDTNITDFIEIPESRIKGQWPTIKIPKPRVSNVWSSMWPWAHTEQAAEKREEEEEKKRKKKTIATRPKRKKPRPGTMFTGGGRESERETLEDLMKQSSLEKSATSPLAKMLTNPIGLATIPIAGIGAYMLYEWARERGKRAIQRAKALKLLAERGELQRLINEAKSRYRAAQLETLLQSDKSDEVFERVGDDEVKIKVACDEAHNIAKLIAGPKSDEAASGKEDMIKEGKYTMSDVSAAALMSLSEYYTNDLHGQHEKSAQIGNVISGWADAASRSITRGFEAAYGGVRSAVESVGNRLGILPRLGWNMYWATLGIPIALLTLMGILSYRAGRQVTDPEGELTTAKRLSDIDVSELLDQAETSLGLPLAAPSYRLRRKRKGSIMAAAKGSPIRRLIVTTTKKDEDED